MILMEVSWKILMYYGRKHFYHKAMIDYSLRSGSELKFDKYEFIYYYISFKNTIFHNVITSNQNTLITLSTYF